jgi:hypothetical protein
VTTAIQFHLITPTLLHWQAYESAVKCDLSSHAFFTADGLILLDPIALADPSTLPAPPAAIFLTNANHARAAAWWRECSGAPIYAPAIAVPDLDVVPDHTLSDGDLTPGGFHTFSIPGGAPGETAYLGHGLCCIGDALIHVDPHGFVLLPPKYCTDPALLPHSLRKLLSCDFDILTFAHGTPLRPNARDRLATLLS